MLGGFCQLVKVWGVVVGGVSPEAVREMVPLSLMVVVKMAASRGSFFSSSRLARRAGSVWRSVGPFGIFCGDPRGAKSLRWAGE